MLWLFWGCSDFDSPCVTENLRYMSLFFCFNRYNSEHISESCCADWGDRSSRGPLSGRELSPLHCGGRHGQHISSDAALGSWATLISVQSLSFLICKERLNDFPKVIQLISRRLRVRIFICGVAVGITMRWCLLYALRGVRQSQSLRQWQPQLLHEKKGLGI